VGKLVLLISVSLDGYMEGPDHDLSWHRVDEELHEHFNAVLRDAGAFLSGRTTFELMADVWPTADANPEYNDSPAMVEFAGIWRDKPKFVWSRTLEKADWNTEVRQDVDPDDVAQLKARYGELILGGVDLASTFLEKGLFDELRVYVHPVMVGAGTSWLARDLALDLRLLETRQFSNGVVLLHYAVD
jgi:dihydrofolate reductase